MPNPEKPLASQALLDYLDQCYPPLSPDRYIRMSEKEVAHYMGQRAVLDKLRADIRAYTSQEKD